MNPMIAALQAYIEESIREACEAAFDAGWDAHRGQMNRQALDRTHPITRDNPFARRS